MGFRGSDASHLRVKIQEESDTLEEFVRRGPWNLKRWRFVFEELVEPLGIVALFPIAEGDHGAIGDPMLVHPLVGGAVVNVMAIFTIVVESEVSLCLSRSGLILHHGLVPWIGGSGRLTLGQ
jgi:hypothetical protein